MNARLISCIGAAFVLAGCNIAIPLPEPGVPVPGAPYGYQAPEFAPTGTKAGETGDPRRRGYDYCRHVNEQAKRNANAHRTGGSILTGLSLAAAGLGTVVSATGEPKDDTGKNQYKAVVIASPLVGGTLGYFALQQFKFSEAADGLASASALAMDRPTEVEAAEACNRAIAAWSDGRSGASKALTDSLADKPKPSPTAAPPSPPPP